MAHPPRSNPPLRSSSAPPSPCITPSTETFVTVVSFMVAAPFSLGSSSVGLLEWSPRISSGPRADGFVGEDGIDLPDGLGQSLIGTHGQGLLHGLGAGEHDLDRHARASFGY